MNRRSKGNGDLFIEGSGQLRLVDKSVEQQLQEKRKVECLGMKFDSEEERRAYFTDRLREKLADPEFRKIPGFPKGTDEDIVRMSDAPWYTACPNPFLADFVRVYGKPYDPKERYERDPFAIDTSVGKTDALYKAHAYHTKVPHLAIVPSILHYTEPGDIVLDGFSGTGMTGVAAQWCGSASKSFRYQIEANWSLAGLAKPRWGARRAVLNDLGPAPTFISANYVRGVDPAVFMPKATELLDELSRNVGWMYETSHGREGAKARINYTVWSEVFSCPECGGEVVFIEHAFDRTTRTITDRIRCPHCTAELLKEHMDLHMETVLDSVTRTQFRRPKRRPFLISYNFNGEEYEKTPDDGDLAVLAKIQELGLPPQFPIVLLADSKMTREGRMAATETKFLHHMYTPRAAQTLAQLWRLAEEHGDWGVRAQMLFFVEQAIWTMSVLNRYRPSGYSQVNQFLSGVFYVPSQCSEPSPWYVLTGKANRLAKAFSGIKQQKSHSIIQTASCESIAVPSNSIDYIFTDPPFGGNIYYADLNILIEAWHRVSTSTETEAIVDKVREKTVLSYQSMMRHCFDEYERVLKPGRWMTIVFSNSSNAVWRAIQEAVGAAGFVVADVRMLDKQQGSFMQVTTSAVKQDLVISAYKPTEALTERFALRTSSPENAWAFVTEHLGHVPIFSSVEGVADVIAERTAQVLHDRMVAFHVQRQLSVPLSTAEFLGGLNQRYPERDGMYFLPTQVADYDRKRNTAAELRQLSLFVIDEASAIQWVRRELHDKPRSFQDLQPTFMREIQNWAKHEQTVELKEILRQNCIHYDGKGPVPSQIHSYLSTNFKEFRNLAKDDPALTAKAGDRWYVPDPGKQGDLEKLRERALLTEFETYKNAKERKLKLFRTEAVRAGFKAAYDGRDYKTIVSVAAKLPENVLQEDEKLLMYYDVASMRLGDE
jgi:predicted RNA-binding Zn-ribbon protein involved in translation (DUF1610 family)/predicted RNA methylase